ncbi:hypothetical protein BDV95DRAFT_484072 [Massariosphaeria phaeospora]|uniref:Vacuolar import and degradation protein 21 n=1 Tax=Massariosphaeria phaeospora TaxID=100035 RepID=A0A7C8ICW8_9PLEO|nr:hypothetical protein BDV95DRAFT_484072 [Massariosphaeria phaeospora]
MSLFRRGGADIAVHRNCEVSRKRKLRELYHYTALVSAARPPQLHDWPLSDEPAEHELHFLDENDITKGHRFSEATLPFPVLASHYAPLPSTLPFQTPSKPAYPAFPKASPSASVGPVATLEEQLRAASASPSVATQPLPSVEAPAQPDNITNVVAKTPLQSRTASPAHAVTPAAEEDVGPEALNEAQQRANTQPPETSTVQTEVTRGDSVADAASPDPEDTALPTPDQKTLLPETSTPIPLADEKLKAPQVLHLPPQEVQEARLKETELKLAKVAEKERKEDEKAAVSSATVPADLISSPSSTVGPYSQATPHAPHHSPDTSPDTDSFHDDAPQPVQSELGGPDPEVQQAKEDHDRDLQIQMQEARERARGDDPPTPDVERQTEDEEAIRLARDGKIRLSGSQNFPGPALTEHVQDVVEEVQLKMTDHAEDRPSEVPAADSLPTPTTTAPEPSTLGSEGVDGASSKPQNIAPLAHEHPTPPADVVADVEMQDAPLPVTEQQNTSPPRPSRPASVTRRISSGSVRRKSVVEMIIEKVMSERVAARPSQLSTTRPQSRDRKSKEISTVIFAKQDAAQASKALHLYSEDYASLQGASQDSGRDYLEGLFRYQAHHPPRSIPLLELVGSARKTLSTAGTLAMIREFHDYKILKRVYQLQNANRWSLRQIRKSAEPARPVTHHDHLIAEMKWMQTDFREERNWKKALAANLAKWCAEYVNCTPEERVSLRIRAHVPTLDSTIMEDEDVRDTATPELIHSGPNETESESVADDDGHLSPFEIRSPVSLFSLNFDDIVMKIDRTPVSDAMFRELPIYEPILEGANDVTPLSFCDPPMLPISKFVTGKLVSKIRGPSRKRSRFEYESEDEPSNPPSRSGTSAEHSMPSTPGRRLFHRNDLAPEMTDVALFNPENKHVRDRLQAAHQFRPPNEFPMPTVLFFENRTSSQWLWEEDQKLRGLVKEYTFNWSLVAQQLSLPSMFVSGSGRRTPWECFERWVQLEGLPAEMSKTQYFRTYQSRLEAAQRTVMAQLHAQQQMQQQQAQQGQAISGQPRRRSTQPIRVERRRENRHLAIIDAMRKLARKRESLAHKVTESQKAAALRKAHEPTAPKSNIHTPQEFSRLKWEREEKMRQKMVVQQELSMRQQLAAQRQLQMQNQANMANGMNQAPRNGTPSNSANATTQMAKSTSQQGQSVPNAAMSGRGHSGQSAMPSNFPNGNMNGISSSGVPQAQMQANMQNAQRMPPPDQMRLAMQRGQFPNNSQQHQFQLQQQQINMASNLTQGMGLNGMPNANMVASMGAQPMNGNMNNSMNGMGKSVASPRMNQLNPSMQSPARPLSSGHMPQLLQLQNSLKQQHPEWSPELVQKSASEQLSKILNRNRLQALNAAAGSSGMNQPVQIGSNVYLQNGTMANSPPASAVQTYQAQLVQQQRLMSQQRQQAGSPGLNARPLSRSATPQNPQLQQSPSMQQAQLSRS